MSQQIPSSMSPESLALLKWSADGLLPAIVQDSASGEVLMMAWMNRESLDLTLQTGQTHFYSRSRARLWHKGATSGHTQTVAEIRVDCDGDVLLVRVHAIGGACHEGYRSCFYRALDGDGSWAISEPLVFEPGAVYGHNHKPD